MASSSSASECCNMANTTSDFSSPITTSYPVETQLDDQVNDIAERIFVAVVLSITSILGVGGNTLVLFSILLSRKLQTQTNIFVVNLCCADFLTCLTLPFQVAAMVIDDHDGGFLSSDAFCAVVTMLTITCLGCSILTLTLISINRFVLITRSKATCRRVFSPLVLVVTLVSTWLIPAAEFGIPSIAGVIELSYYPRFRLCAWYEKYPLSKYLIALTLILALCITLACYVRTFFFVRQHTRTVENSTSDSVASRQNADRNEPLPSIISTSVELRSQLLIKPSPIRNNLKILQVGVRNESEIPSSVRSTQATPSVFDERSAVGLKSREGNHVENVRMSKANSKSSKRRNMEAEISKNLFLVVCVFVVCIVPFVSCLALKSCQRPFIYTISIICMGSCVNPVIYGIRHPHFRPVFACIIMCRLANIPQPSRFTRRLLNRR